MLTGEGVNIIRNGATRRESVAVRSTTVVMERRLGLLAPSREVRFVGRRELDELQDRKRIVPSVQHGIRLDEAQVRRLLLRGPTQWIRSVADVSLIGREGHWLPVRVDPASETVTGMPDRWQPYLSGPLIDYARTLGPADVTTDEDTVESWLSNTGASRQAWDPTPDEIERVTLPVDASAVAWVNGSSADEELSKQLAVCPTGATLVVATPTLTSEKLDQHSASMVEAARRGTNLQLTWHDASPEGQAAAKKLAWDARPGDIALPESSLPYALSAVCCVADEGARTWLGDVDWLGPSSADRSAIVFDDPAVAATALQIVSAAWRRTSGGQLAGAPQRLSALVADLERTSAERELPREAMATIRIATGAEAVAIAASPRSPGTTVIACGEGEGCVAVQVSGLPREPDDQLSHAVEG